MTQAVLLKSSIRSNFSLVCVLSTRSDGWQKNSPARGAGAVNIKQAMNQADGILHRKIKRTVRSCHLPKLPFTSEMMSTFSILFGVSLSSGNGSIAFEFAMGG